MKNRKVSAGCAAIAAVIGIVAGGFVRASERSGGADIAKGGQIALNGTDNGAAPCSSCHGESGEGNAEQGFPRIAGMSAWYLSKQLQDYASGARENEIMQPIAQALAAEETRAVTAYYAGATAAYPDPAPVPPAQWHRGRTLVQIGDNAKSLQACVSCHGPDGRGLPPDIPSIAGQHATYIQQQFQAWTDGRRHNDPAGQMAAVVHQLDDGDREALAAYLAGLRPEVVAGISTRP